MGSATLFYGEIARNTTIPDASHPKKLSIYSEFFGLFWRSIQSPLLVHRQAKPPD
jgi:hypothetical protein